MDLLGALGDFFATFEPKDWVTGALALGALIVSILVAGQRRRYHPRPLLKIEKSALITDPMGGPMLGPAQTPIIPYASWTVANRGEATAHDVRFYAISDSLAAPIEQSVGKIADGGSDSAQFFLVDTFEMHNEMGDIVEAMRSGEGKVTGAKAWVTWREGPNMKKVHRLNVKF